MLAQIEKIQSLTEAHTSVVMEFLNRLHDLVFADLEKMMGHKFHNRYLWVGLNLF